MHKTRRNNVKNIEQTVTDLMFKGGEIDYNDKPVISIRQMSLHLAVKSGVISKAIKRLKE